MSSERNINDELLFRYLSGTVEVEEQAAIELWLTEDESRQHQLEEVRMMWAAANVQRPAEVNAEAAWLQLKQKINQDNKDRRIINWKTVWSSAAAVVLLIFGAYVLQQVFVKSSTSDKPFVAIEQPSTQPASIADKEKTIQEEPKQTATPDEPSAEVRPAKETIGRAHTSGSSEGEPLATAEKKNEEICNNTQCPLEICIVQSLPCDGNKETTFAHCSLLQPDASGLLHYKEYNNIDCRAKVREIRISKTNTGETIVLNESSTPVTAQEFFDYMTGYKTGNIVAGNFESDCDNPCMEQSINLDNRFGTPVLH
jgi:hypothetical protein